MPAEPKHTSDLLSTREVSEALAIGRSTVHVMKARGEMPEVVTTIGGHPFWRRHDILVWGLNTGRLRPTSPLWNEARKIPAAELRP